MHNAYEEDVMLEALINAWHDAVNNRDLAIDPDQATSASSGPAPDQPNPSINCRNTSS
jgi:hypothetical protein